MGWWTQPQSLCQPSSPSCQCSNAPVGICAVVGGIAFASGTHFYLAFGIDTRPGSFQDVRLELEGP